MHVLAFEEQPTRFAGGQERSLFAVLESFARAGTEVSLCYRKEGELLTEYRKFVHEAFCTPSRVAKRPYGRFLTDLARLRIKASRRKWTVLYANQMYDTPIAASLGLLSGLPVVCHLRMLAPDGLSRQYRWGLERCARLIAGSHSTKASYVRAGIAEERIAVVHNGIDMEAFRPRPLRVRDATGGRRRLAYFGRLCPRKGLETLLEAFARLDSNDRTAFELHIYGAVRSSQAGPEYLDHLKTLAGPGLGRTIFFHPHIADVRDAMTEADLVVMPTLWEAFSRVVVEAMALGIPVVASDTGGIPEILAPRFADHLVPPGDAPALAAAIVRLAGWRATQPGLGAECRRWVEARFSHTERLAEVLDVIRQAGERH